VRHERRKNERIPIGDELRAELVGYDWPVRLVNISAGGFAVNSPIMVPAVGRLEFRFSTADRRWSTVLTARASYLLPDPTHQGSAPLYRTGFAFEQAAEPGVRDRIAELMEKIERVEA
jgi:hypothetical protein